MHSLHQSPLDDGFVQNPYAIYGKVLADKDPVRFWEDYGKVAVFDLATIQALLRDRRLGRAKPDSLQDPQQSHLAAFNALEAVSMLDLEPPDHTRLRGLVLRAFTSRRIKNLQSDIYQICDELLLGFPIGSFDLVDAYCSVLPVRVIARLLGVPEDKSPDLLRWSNAMVAIYQASRTTATEIAANQAATEFTAFLSRHIDARRKKPRDDLLTDLIEAESEGQKLTRQEMIGTCILLLNAGHEATVHTLGNGVKALLQCPVSQTELVKNHIDGTVEEILRYDPPLHVFNRFAYEKIDLGAHTLQQGQEIMLVLGAAGHDPQSVGTPTLFDPLRTTFPHAAFGGGLHFCVGAPLARMELKIGLQRLFRAYPNLHLKATPRYANCYHFHGLERLMVST